MPDDSLLMTINDPKIKDRIGKLPDTKREAFYSAVFNKTVKPKLANAKLSQIQLLDAKQKWIGLQMGKSITPLKSDDEQAPPTKVQELEALGAGAYAKATGMVKTLAEWDQKLDKRLGAQKRDFLGQVIDKVHDQAAIEEKQAWDIAKATSPRAATVGALAGDVAMTSGPMRGGSMLGRGAGKLLGVESKALMGALSGAGAMTAASPLYSTKGADIAKNAAYGAAGGALLDPLIERLTGMTSSRGKVATPKVEPKVQTPVVDTSKATPETAATKWWSDMTPEEQAAFKAKKVEAARAKTATSPTPKQGVAVPQTAGGNVATSKWRQQQYIKLKKAGVLNEQTKESVRSGKSASEILGTPAQHVAANVATQVENPQVEKAVKGIETLGAEKPVAAPTVAEESKKLSPEISKQYLDKLDEAYEHLERAKNPMVRAKIQKTIDNIKGILGGDPNALKRVKKAEGMATSRAEAAASQPSSTVAFEGGGSEGPGVAVPVAKTQVPIVEIESGLKALNLGQMAGDKLYNAVVKGNKYLKMEDEEKRDALEKVYRMIGEKMGIEDAEDMSLEDLYQRLTTKK